MRTLWEGDVLLQTVYFAFSPSNALPSETRIRTTLELYRVTVFNVTCVTFSCTAQVERLSVDQQSLLHDFLGANITVHDESLPPKLASKTLQLLGEFEFLQ